jgi:hypothetical protein
MIIILYIICCTLKIHKYVIAVFVKYANPLPLASDSCRANGKKFQTVERGRERRYHRQRLKRILSALFSKTLQLLEYFGITEKYNIITLTLE